MATQPSSKRTLEPAPAIPDRLYFKIGDVARICDLETYVLRFWETQFPQLKPNKSGTGQRLFRRRDVELVLEIKRLVHAEGYTLAGARQALDQRRPAPQLEPKLDSKSEAKPGPERNPQSRPQILASDSNQRLDRIAAAIGHARGELREIAGLLAVPVPQLTRHRSRLTTLPDPSESLFPA